MSTNANSTENSMIGFTRKSKATELLGNGFHKSLFRPMPFRPRSRFMIHNANSFKHNLMNAMKDIELRVEYIDKDIWLLEYGTKPITKMVDPSDKKLLDIIEIKQFAAWEVVAQVLEKRKDLWDSDFVMSDTKWFTAIINVSYDAENNYIVIDYIEMDGDKSGLSFLKREIEKRLESKGHIIVADDWWTRGCYY
jgi:hypothetical protein